MSLMNLISDLGPHAAYIWASYGVAALTLAGLVCWLIADGRYQQGLLDELDARGVRRRSGGVGREG
jgi:heme exporter protein D